METNKVVGSYRRKATIPTKQELLLGFIERIHLANKKKLSPNFVSTNKSIFLTWFWSG